MDNDRSEPFDAILAGGGAMGRRIAAFDWTVTPLGAIAGWDHSLRMTLGLVLRSPTPLVLLWGTRGTMLFNDAYAGFAGRRAAELLGSDVRAGWGEVADFNDNVMTVCLAGGTLSYRDQALTLDRDGGPQLAWMDLDYSPVPGPDGRPAGVLAVVIETTAAKLMRDAAAASEARLRFLDGLARAVAGCRAADEILAIVTQRSAAHLGVAICAYADMDADADGFVIRGDWHAPGAQALVGRYRLADFGARVVAELGAGRPLIVNDAAAELPAGDAQAFAALGVAATLCMPLIKDGRLTALMAIHDTAPRRWRDEELATLREVTERSWAHVERVRAEEALAAREMRNRQVLDGATHSAIIATDAEGRVTRWSAGAARILGWSEAEMLGERLDRLFTPEDRRDGLPRRERDEALARGHAQNEGWRLRRSGERFWGVGELSPLRDAAGAPAGFVKVLRDRTEGHRARAALDIAEGQSRRAQEAGGVGLFSIDLADNMLSATPEFCRIYGVPVAPLLHPETLERLIVPADASLVSNSSGRSTGSAPLDVEYRIRRADTGEERVVARKAEYERDADGRVVRMAGAVQDVTERRHTQRALERSEAGFSALTQVMPIQAWTARADGTIDWFNAQTYRFTGAAEGALDAEGWRAFVHPDDRAASAARWAAAVARGDDYDVELRLRDRADHYRWHLSRAVALRDGAGRVASWVGTNTDIHAQKLAEAAYAADRDRLWTISQDLMLVCTLAGGITAVNPSAIRLLGWDEAEMVGANLADFIHPDDREATAAEVGRLADGRRTLAFETRCRTKAGDYRLLAWTGVPDAGRIHAVGRDITEQRATEEALRQSQKMEAVGQLTGGIAHDFNNLLQGITGSLDIMGSRIDQGRLDDLPRWLGGAKTSAARAAALTHRLLAFSRRQPLDPRPVRSNPLIASMEDMLRRTLGERIALELVLAGGLWLTRCDPNQLESAILNLAINARDAMPDGGRLTIETGNAHLDSRYAARDGDVTPGQYVCICVSDSGTGMTAETIARAFDPFFTTKPIGQGTGLGLSMIYGFARQSEGKARIYSEVGRGTTVKLYLPRHRGAEQPEETPPAPSEPPVAEGEVVLVVEDEAVVRGLIVEVLGELGYRAIEAEDGPQGLAILQSPRRIDLLITDIGLPGLNGRQVADGGRVSRPGLKVLFMTGYAENAARAAGFLEPGMAMITKPFAMEVLAQRIRDIIEEG